MTNCQSSDHKSANLPAVAKVYWPGSDPVPMCQQCVDQARAVAKAMSFHFVVEALPGFVEVKAAKVVGT